MSDGTDHTDTAAQVRAAAHDYEAALVRGDTEAAAEWFAPSDTVSRFGPEGHQAGPDQVAALRARTEPVAAPTWIHDEVRVLTPDLALHLAILHRGPATIQRTQLWQRNADGWRIEHAHVGRSERATS